MTDFKPHCLLRLSSVSIECVSVLSSIFFNLLKSPSFVPSFSKLLLKTLPNGEYSNLACSITPRLHLNFLPVKYS